MSSFSSEFVQQMFALDGNVAVVTGGTGVLGGAMAMGLARAGASVAIVGRRKEKADVVVEQIKSFGGTALAVPGDVMDKAQMETVRDAVLKEWGKIDILINAAGGTTPQATVAPDKTIFDMSMEAMSQVVDLNLIGTMIPSQVLGEVMAKQKRGAIVNISSMNAQKALTRAVAYSAGKAAVENFTRWLSVELATKFGPELRVNAIAPGFFVGEQNRSLLLNEDGSLTPRGELMIHHTPLRRFGKAEELVGALVWLCSPAASFVNGTVIMVDGGVNAFSGI